MAVKTPNELQGNGTYEREAEMATFMYGSTAEYFTAFMNTKKTEPHLTSQRFMTKSISAIKKVYAEHTKPKTPEPEIPDDIF